MKYVIYLLVFIHCLQTSFASPAPRIQSGDISKEKCKEYSNKVKKCGHSVQEITQGVKLAEENEFPHMVLIGYDDDKKNEIKWACAGSLISDQYVITAAHCLTTKHTGNATYVKIGVHNLKDNSKAQEFKIIARIEHPDFSGSGFFYNDIGLVKLDKKIQFSENAYPACLNTNTGLNVQKAILGGFNRPIDAKSTREKLKKAVVEIKNEKECSDEYNGKEGRIDHKTQFCGQVLSSEEETYNSISGDSMQIYHNEEDGVQCMYDIIGFASFGKRSSIISPDVFTRISHYIGWIESVVWP